MCIWILISNLIIFRLLENLHVAACVWPGGVKRKDEESIILRFFTPNTLALESTTAMVSFSLPIIPGFGSVQNYPLRIDYCLQVEDAW
jgi:hypothetical protein